MRKVMGVALFLAVCLFIVSTTQAGEELSFKGKTVQDKSDGTTIMGEEDSGLLVFSNLKYHYALMLPYSEEWVFTRGNPELLKGNAGLVNLTIWIDKTKITPKQYLEKHEKLLQEPGRVKGLEKIEIISYRDLPVLRNIVDGEKAGGSDAFRGVKIANFFAAKRWGDYIYVVHLSRVIPPEDKKTFDEKEFLNMVTTGFHVDFMREKK